MEQPRGEEQSRRGDEQGGIGIAVVLATFGIGLLAGAVVTLLTTPEPGEAVRRRMRRGVEKARGELEEIVDDARESWERVRDDARDAMTHTTTKIKDAVKATKEAVMEGDRPAPKTP